MTIGIIALFILLFYGVGILTMLKGIAEIRYGIGARSWPIIDAHLNKCEFVIRRAGNGLTYHVSVKYNYVLAGVCHTGDSLAIGYFASSNREAHEVTYRKVIGMTRFVVRYNPAKPDMSTIFPSENSLIFGTFTFAAGWLMVTTCFFLAMLAMSGVGSAILAWFR